LRVERRIQPLLSNLPEDIALRAEDETAYGMVVADGMGGMPAGDVASRMALSTLVDLVIKTPDWILRMNRRKAAVVKRRMIQRFRVVDRALREHGDRDPRLSGMGTTMTVACSLGADLFLGHIGDSRAYLLREGGLIQLTRDHTLAEAMIGAGLLAPEDATVHGMRHVLTAALGSTAQPTDPEVQRLYLRHGDQLLLCTDGLTECLGTNAIRSILSSTASAEDACQRLVDAALKGTAADNVTVVLARYRFPRAA
jgi:protein phosphatase